MCDWDTVILRRLSAKAMAESDLGTRIRLGGFYE